MVLALLVHLLLVLWLGNRSGGLARPAEGARGVISIHLRSQGADGQREAGLAAEPAAKSPIASSASPATVPILLPSAPLVREDRWVDGPRSQMLGGPSGFTAHPPSDAGSPDAGASAGHDLAAAPSLPASSPRLTLDLTPRRGGASSAQGSRGLSPLSPLLPHPAETRPKLAEGIEKAAKPDCRQAYAGMGLLGAGALVLDTLRDKGCRW